MRGGFEIPGYFSNCVLDEDRLKENKLFGSTVYIYKDHALYEPGLLGKKVLVFKNGGIYEPGILGKRLFNVTKYGEVLETGLFGKSVGAIPSWWAYDEDVKNENDIVPSNGEQNEYPDHILINNTRPNDLEDIELELGYVADVTNTKDEATTITVPKKYNKLTAVAPFLQKRIETIEIHSCVKSIYLQSIGCLKRFVVDENNPIYSSDQGLLFNKEKNKLLKVPKDIDFSSIVLPESVCEISDFAFGGCQIKEIRIPNTIKTIGNKAFSCCYKLKSVYIPDTVLMIGKNVFEFDDKVIIRTNLSKMPEGWDQSVKNVKEIIFSCTE